MTEWSDIKSIASFTCETITLYALRDWYIDAYCEDHPDCFIPEAEPDLQDRADLFMDAVVAILSQDADEAATLHDRADLLSFIDADLNESTVSVCDSELAEWTKSDLAYLWMYGRLFKQIEHGYCSYDYIDRVLTLGIRKVELV